jgi:hypothetical protein
LDLLHGTDTLRNPTRLVRLQKHGDPVLFTERGSKEGQWRYTVNRHG